MSLRYLASHCSSPHPPARAQASNGIQISRISYASGASSKGTEVLGHWQRAARAAYTVGVDAPPSRERLG